MNPLILLAAGEAATAPTAKEQVVKAAYLVAIVMFIFGIKRLGRVRTAKGGNALAGVAMAIAIVATLVDVYGEIRPEFIIGGAVAGSVIGFLAAKMVDMREMPEMVALFNGSGGAASCWSPWPWCGPSSIRSTGWLARRTSRPPWSTP